MLAEIITIGDEILIGQTVDTNSAWIGKELNARGVELERISSIRDTSEAISTALNEAKSRAKIIIMTGGLGPTNDDITKQTLVEYFDTQLISSPEALENIKVRFKARGIELLQINIDQALVPANCIPIMNSKGTAPGMWFEQDGIIYVSMPGVPYEMKAMMRDFVFPRLKALNNKDQIIHQTITVVNIPESILSHKIRHIEDALPPHIKLAFLPHLNLVRVRLTAKSREYSKEELNHTLNQYFNQIKEIIGPSWFEGEKSMAQIIGEMLIAQGKTLGSIESCTGGYMAHGFTKVPGSSAYFQGSYVTYSNQFKIDLIGVDEELFTTVGSVSEEVATQMALKGRIKLGVDYCLAATGVAGPTGATEYKPIGLVYIGLAKPDGQVVVTENHFKGSRMQVIERTAYMAMEMLRQALLVELNQNEQTPALK